MDKQTKYLLVGTTLAMLILLGGYLTSIYENSQLSTLHSQLSTLNEKCKTETAKAARQPWSRTPETSRFCDPDMFSKLGGDNIQKQIDESLSTSGRTFNNAKIIALFLFLLFGSPYAWYFLLRRVRELRNAIAGKQPTE